jgi:four helix bundle protein
MEKPHKRLDVWKQAINLVGLVYEIAKSLPKDEEYGLISQIKRAALSIPGNIAEGAARQTKKEYIQFLYIARGSISEMDTYFEIAMRLGYISPVSITAIDKKMIDVDKMLTGLIHSLKRRS